MYGWCPICTLKLRAIEKKTAIQWVDSILQPIDFSKFHAFFHIHFQHVFRTSHHIGHVNYSNEQCESTGVMDTEWCSHVSAKIQIESNQPKLLCGFLLEALLYLRNDIELVRRKQHTILA